MATLTAITWLIVTVSTTTTTGIGLGLVAPVSGRHQVSVGRLKRHVLLHLGVKDIHKRRGICGCASPCAKPTLALWNVMYDEVLRLEFPVGSRIVDFADDITLEVYGKSIDEGKFTVDYPIAVVEDFISFRKLE